MLEPTSVLRELVTHCGFNEIAAREFLQRYSSLLEKGLVAYKVADQIVLAERKLRNLSDEQDFPDEVLDYVSR